jgi:hypothetical protein
LLPLEPVPPGAGRWRELGTPAASPHDRRCANLLSACACNWLLAEDDPHAGEPPLCRCCRLTRTLPEASHDAARTLRHAARSPAPRMRSLHLADMWDAARNFGIDGERVELECEGFGAETLSGAPGAEAAEFLQLVNSWMELTGVLNELSGSMGMADSYPFMLSGPAVLKLHLVHRVIAAAAPA